jgi:hypothetical protein
MGNGASVALISNNQQCAPFGIVCRTEFMPQGFVKGGGEQLAFYQWSAARDATRNCVNRLLAKSDEIIREHWPQTSPRLCRGDPYLIRRSSGESQPRDPRIRDQYATATRSAYTPAFPAMRWPRQVWVVPFAA